MKTFAIILLIVLAGIVVGRQVIASRTAGTGVSLASLSDAVMPWNSSTKNSKTGGPGTLSGGSGTDPTSIAAAPRQPAALAAKGVLRKVLIVRDGVVLRRSPLGEVADGAGVQFFQQMFVFAESRSDAGTIAAYQVGTDPFKPLGWVSADEARSWDTRLALRLTADSGVFATPEDAERFLAGGTGSTGELATKVGDRAQPFAIGSAAGAAREQPYPVIDTRSLRLSDGRDVVLTQLLFVGRRANTGGTAAASASATKALPAAGAEMPSDAARNSMQGARERQLLAQIDFRVAVDFTASMQDAIDQSRAEIRRTAESTRSAYPQADIRYSALAYRDFADATWATKWLGAGLDLASFDAGMTSERADAGGDTPEAMFEGVHAALSGVWTTDQTLGQRILLVVAQTSGHESGPGNPRKLTIDELVKRAQSLNVTVFALQVPFSDSAESARLRDQLHRLCGPTGGRVFDLSNANTLRTAIQTAIRERSQSAAARVRVHEAVEAGRGGTPADVAARTGLAVTEVQAAFTFLRSSTNVFQRAAAASGSTTPGSATDDLPMAATGWVVSRLGTQSFADTHIFCSKAEIDFLLGELQQFVSLSASPEDIAQIGSSGRRLQADGWLGSARNESLAAWLSSYGVFIHPDSLLWFSQQELLAMPESKRRTIRELIQSRHLPTLTLARNSDAWSSSGWGFVAQRDFP